MKTYLYKIDTGMQIRIPDNDEEMKIFHEIDTHLENVNRVIVTEKAVTFETPIYFYEYKGIPFSMMFDEMVDETFFFVGKEYDYKVIQRLIESIEVAV